MMSTNSLFVISLLVFTGCSTTHPRDGTKADSETVLVTYHVQSGKEAEFEAVLSHAWEIYASAHMVFSQPHVIVRETEDGDKARYVEVFTWVKAPDHAPESVKTIWTQEHSLCEPRSGHTGIEGGVVKLIAGS